MDESYTSVVEANLKARVNAAGGAGSTSSGWSGILPRTVVYWVRKSGIEGFALIFCFVGIVLGYVTLASPSFVLGWFLFASALSAAVGVVAFFSRHYFARSFQKRLEAGVFPGGLLVHRAAVSEASHLLAWRALIASLCFAAAAAAIYVAGISWLSVIAVMMFAGAAVLAAMPSGRSSTAELALLAVRSFPLLPIKGSCRLVFWLPARVALLRKHDAMVSQRTRSPPYFTMLQANARRYSKDGRGPLPERLNSFTFSDAQDGRLYSQGLAVFVLHIVPLALLLAVLSFPFASSFGRLVSPLIPEPPFLVSTISAQRPNPETTPSDTSLNVPGSQDDLTSQDGRGSAGEQGDQGDGARSDVGATDGSNAVSSNSVNGNSDGAGSAGSNSQSEADQPQSHESSREAGDGAGLETAKLATPRNGSGAGEEISADGNTEARASGSAADVSEPSSNGDTGGGGSAQAPGGAVPVDHESQGESDQFPEQESGGEVEEDGGSESVTLEAPGGGVGDESSEDENSFGGESSTADEDSVNSAQSGKIENGTSVANAPEKIQGNPTPPRLKDPEPIISSEGDGFTLRQIGLIFGDEGRPPEALRVFQLPEEKLASRRAARSDAEPKQHLPAWIESILRRN